MPAHVASRFSATQPECMQGPDLCTEKTKTDKKFLCQQLGMDFAAIILTARNPAAMVQLRPGTWNATHWQSELRLSRPPGPLLGCLLSSKVGAGALLSRPRHARPGPRRRLTLNNFKVAAQGPGEVHAGALQSRALELSGGSGQRHNAA